MPKLKVVLATVGVLAVVGTGAYVYLAKDNHTDTKNTSTSATVTRVKKDPTNSVSESSSSNSSSSTKSAAAQSESKTSNSDQTKTDNLIYYSGTKQVKLPTNNGNATMDNMTKTYWPSKLTIDGKKQNVVAAYYKMGYFEIFTKQPTAKAQNFTNDGDMNYLMNYVGKAGDLDDLASRSQRD